jgi:cyclic beta-1,2-glucan synthetase
MLAWTQAKVQIAHLGIDAGQASLFQRLAGHVLYAAPTVRPSSETLRRGAGPQSGLWSLGISGDLPIVLLRIADAEDIDLARQLLQAHEYWRIKQLAVDLVILNERATSYAQDLQIALETLVRTSESRPRAAVQSTQLGRVFVRRADLMSAATRQLLIAVARAVLVGQRGRLSDQLDRAPEPRLTAPPKLPWGLPVRAAATAPRTASLEYYNGLGGFADDGREYVTILGPGQSTPTPWINVVANAGFGFQVATEGSGYTWCANSRERQLTQWSNDPVTDRSGEAFYLRDDDTGVLWSPTASPIRDDAATYVAHHGRGYSRFNVEKNEISVDLRQFVPLADPIKVSRLAIENRSSRTRRLSVVGFVEWVLGRVRAVEAPFIMTELDADTGALMARNAWNPLFAARIAFIDFGGRQADYTGDRREFIGRNGTLSSPAALATAAPLSNRVGAGLDPCGVLRTRVELAPHARIELAFVLGDAENLDEARRLVLHYRTTDLDAVQLAVREYWDGVLGAVQVKTPDRAMDILLNGWLLYQTLACRVVARSAFYQASGAYGFRDQLQDGMALVHACPRLTREHLLRAAGRQFVEGDVLHWWLPQSRQGVRTRISDDRAWLAYCVAHYVGATGDRDVLDAAVPFIEGPRLAAGEHESFFEATISDEVGALFEHCARALDQSLSLGAHGLPLIGTGDWNDGMNRVGEAGQGESVWLGWFLYATLSAFAPLADTRGDTRRAENWRTHAAALRLALEREAWDGEWYRRGNYDDGAPLGSAASDECRIDSIAQSWAVLSGAAEHSRAACAMASVERELTRPVDGVALLFAPPFDQTLREPGYVKGYPPGIRENGGQYTHAVAWSIMALAALGEGDKAAGLWALVNPINHSRSRAAVQRYKVEPYVIAADVYATRPHVGRGGWTWYTGSAGWLQRAGIESILGVRIQGAVLSVDPRVPKAWRCFEVTLRHRSAQYQIRVDIGGAGTGQVLAADCDGAPIAARPVSLTLVDDGATHQVRVQFG